MVETLSRKGFPPIQSSGWTYGTVQHRKCLLKSLLWEIEQNSELFGIPGDLLEVFIQEMWLTGESDRERYLLGNVHFS